MTVTSGTSKKTTTQVNPEDIKAGFWKHTWIISLEEGGTHLFEVSANHETDALDFVMDYCVENNLQGHYAKPGDEDYDEIDKEAVDYGEYIQAGNFGYFFSTPTHAIGIRKAD